MLNKIIQIKSEHVSNAATPTRGKGSQAPQDPRSDRTPRCTAPPQCTIAYAKPQPPGAPQEGAIEKDITVRKSGLIIASQPRTHSLLNQVEAVCCALRVGLIGASPPYFLNAALDLGFCFGTLPLRMLTSSRIPPMVTASSHGPNVNATAARDGVEDISRCTHWSSVTCILSYSPRGWILRLRVPHDLDLCSAIGPPPNYSVVVGGMCDLPE